MQMVHNTYNMYHYFYIYQFNNRLYNIRLIITVMSVMSQCKYSALIMMSKVPVSDNVDIFLVEIFFVAKFIYVCITNMWGRGCTTLFYW